jgi:nucleotidyltransferase/DNA polymerase involved in DNA repair
MILPIWMSKKQIIAHIDMDCFYCSCELKRNSKLKGKPVMVGGTEGRGVVSAANYEARKFGVFSATAVAKAKKLCPEGIFIYPDRKYYVQESKQIMKVFAEFTDLISQVSIDEAYLNLTKYSKKFDNLKNMAKKIQDAVVKNTQLTCSIGVAESRIVAKIASDYKKPAGITIVDDQKEFLAPLVIEKIPGIGKVAKEHYNNNGIYKIGDLAKLDKFEVLEKFGKHGIQFYNVAKGLDFSQIKVRKSVKSISREDTFRKDLFNSNHIRDKIIALSLRVHKDLKKREFKTVSIKIKYSDFSVITRDFTVRVPTSSLHIIEENALKLFNNVIEEEKAKENDEKIKRMFENNLMLKPIRLIGVKLSNLSRNKDKQMTLDKYFF